MHNGCSQDKESLTPLVLPWNGRFLAAKYQPRNTISPDLHTCVYLWNGDLMEGVSVSCNCAQVAKIDKVGCPIHEFNDINYGWWDKVLTESVQRRLATTVAYTPVEDGTELETDRNAIETAKTNSVLGSWNFIVDAVSNNKEPNAVHGTSLGQMAPQHQSKLSVGLRSFEVRTEHMLI